jgi:xylulokinase
MARAAVESVLCSLADGIGNLADCGITPQRVVLIGGAAQSPAVRSIAPAIFGVPVTVPEPAEYVALGAARQAAWALRQSTGAGAAGPPDWAGPPTETFTAEPRPDIRDRYATLRDDTLPWHERTQRDHS